MDIKRDDYIYITVKWKGGFTHIVPCRGYNFKSQIKFNESLLYVESFTWKLVTQKEYEDRLWGSLPAADTESMNSTTSSTVPPKRGKSQKKDGSKPSTTKASVKSVTENSKSKTQSSTRKKAKPTGSDKETTNEQRTSKGKTLKENPAKGNSRTKTSKDTEAVSKPKRATKQAAKRTPSNGKEARTELREPKVRVLREPKKNVRRNDDSGKTSPTRNGNRKRKTQ